MKNLACLLLACLLVTACAQPEKEKSSPAPQQTEVNSDVLDQARALSQAYAEWTKDLELSQNADAKVLELTQAYALALRGQKYLGTSRASNLVWLVEKFKTIKNPAAESSEMISLAREFIQKEYQP